ncbi:MAG: complex I NDUFA9 subunit family protein [Bdellovibrionales bacterium]|jgi:NADH dehydrogenase
MTSARVAIVFGGSGFLGHTVVQALVAKGYTVRVPTRDLNKAQDLKVLGAVGQVIPFLASIRSDASVALAVEGCDVAINLIGPLCEKNKKGASLAPVETAARLARLAKSAGVKHFVHISSLGQDRRAASCFAQTKVRGEEAVRAFFPSAVIFRPSLMFGPRDRFFTRLALMARYWLFLPLLSGGVARFQPVYVGDVAAAIMVALSNPSAQGGTFDLVGPRTYSLRDLMLVTARVMNKKCILFPVPVWLARAVVKLLSLLPSPPLTREHIDLLLTDSLSRDGSALPQWGITPAPLEDILPTYLC